MEKEKKSIPFECTACGACCTMKNFQFIQNKKHWGVEMTDEDKCIHLSKDNKCKIYENRPLICNTEAVYDRIEEIKDIEPILYENIKKFKSKEEYYKVCHIGCNLLIDMFEIDPSYKIKIKDDYDRK